MQLGKSKYAIQIPFFGVLLAFYFSQYRSDWILLKLWRLRGDENFEDLNAILRNVDCYKSIGWKIYESVEINSCNNYVYGSWLIRFLDFLGLGSNNLTAIAIFGIISTSWILASLFAQMFSISWKMSIPFLTILISPPVLLLMERQNFDWLILLLLYVSAYFFSKERFLLGLLILSLSALFKFYTLPIFLYLVVVSPSKRNKLYSFGLMFCILVQIVLDLVRLRSIIIGPWFAAFGNSIWAKYLMKFDLNLNPLASAGLGMLISVLVGLILIRYGNFISLQSKGKQELKSHFEMFSIFSTIAFVGCYFAGLNYDYRLIFLAPLCIAFFNGDFSNRKISTIVVLVGYWFSYNSKYLQPLGDLAINFIVVATLLFSFSWASNRWGLNRLWTH